MDGDFFFFFKRISLSLCLRVLRAVPKADTDGKRTKTPMHCVGNIRFLSVIYVIEFPLPYITVASPRRNHMDGKPDLRCIVLSLCVASSVLSPRLSNLGSAGEELSRRGSIVQDDTARPRARLHAAAGLTWLRRCCDRETWPLSLLLIVHPCCVGHLQVTEERQSGHLNAT